MDQDKKRVCVDKKVHCVPVLPKLKCKGCCELLKPNESLLLGALIIKQIACAEEVEHVLVTYYSRSQILGGVDKHMQFPC